MIAERSKHFLMTVPSTLHAILLIKHTTTFQLAETQNIQHPLSLPRDEKKQFQSTLEHITLNNVLIKPY